MARNLQNPADETVTVRLPFGTAAKVRAATGQPFSRIVRHMVVALLAKHVGEGQPDRLGAVQAEVTDVVNKESEQ